MPHVNPQGVLAHARLFQPMPLVRIVRWHHVATMVAARRLAVTDLARHEVAIFLSLDGGEFQVASASFRGSTGAFVTQPAASHAIRAECRSVCVVVNLTNSRYPAMRAFADQATKVLERSAFAHLDEQLEAFFYGNPDRDTAQALAEAVIDVVLRGTPAVKPLDSRIPWVMIKLEQDIDYPFQQLAQELGMSTSRLSHVFTHELGLSFRSYQSWGRMVLAWELVTIRHDLSVAQIAKQMGFSDTPHLSRTFLRNTGLTATQLRNPKLVEVIGPTVITYSRLVHDPA